MGTAIRAQRLSLGLSQEALGYRARLDRTYVSGVERGVRNLTVKSLAQLSSALGVPASQLLAEAERSMAS